MKSKIVLYGLSIAVVLQLGVLAGSAQTNKYLFIGSRTNITLNPGTYIITAYGAPGGGDFNQGGFGGGRGAEMSAEFNFSTSTNLTLLVGGGGGGGGSFVVEGSTPLVIAGGGGGGGNYHGAGRNGNVSTNGGGGENGDPSIREEPTGGTGGTNGGGGAGGLSLFNYYGDYGAGPGGGGGGGGFLSNGGDGIVAGVGDVSGGGGGSYASGAAGGSYAGGVGRNSGYGGYGGGGGGGDSQEGGGGGGGGGYSGGGGGGVGAVAESIGGGGGGGSIIDLSAIAKLAEVSGILSPDDPYNGEIIIIAVPPPIKLSLEMLEGYPLLNLYGALGSNFMVQFDTNLSDTNWINLLSVTNLPSSPYPFIDYSGVGQPARFYRAFLAP